MADNICSNKHFNFFLIFKSQIFAANKNIFKKIAEEMNERAAANGRKKITHSEI